jgi:adenylate cyclase
MTFLQRIEKRVAEPDDSETRRTQKSNGLSNQIQVTEAVRKKLEGRYHFEAREPIYVKGKGTMVTYLLEP